MAPPKGSQNNPRGRPPKSRALTTILESALAKTIPTATGLAARKRVLAELMAEFVTTGIVHMPDGRVLDATPKDWIETVKWLYAHIDGPPKQEIEQTGGLTITVVYANPTDTP